MCVKDRDRFYSKLVRLKVDRTLQASVSILSTFLFQTGSIKSEKSHAE